MRSTFQNPKLRCILAPNPSPMTGPGTNTYILGEKIVVIVDPGPAIQSHQAAILAALEPGEKIAAILITHSHLDHSALAPSLSAAADAPVLAFGGVTEGQSAAMRRWIADGGSSGGEGVDTAFTPDRRLADDEVLSAGNMAIAALHTPGHFGNHLCFACGSMILTGDLVMGWASTLISPPDGDVGDYRRSLARLAERDAVAFYPGHGAMVANPRSRIAELLAHRQMREDAIVAALRAGAATEHALTKAVYTDIPAGLLPAAVRNVLAHLIDLQSRGLVEADHQTGAWRLL